MQKDKQEKMLQTLFMIQQMQARTEAPVEAPMPEEQEIPSKKSSGIAT